MAPSASSSSSTTLVSSSSTVTPNFVLSNIANLVPIKLDSTNFLLWKSLFRPILRSHQLEHFIDGSKPIPSPEIISANGETSPNHVFSVWFERDQTLLSWINATLSAFALPYIVGKETAKDAWETLEHRHDPVSLEELHALLVCEELSLADDITIEAFTAFIASKSTLTSYGRSPASSSSYQRRPPNSASRSYRNSNNRHSGASETSGHSQPPQNTGSSTSRPLPTYQICGKLGHLAIDCYHRMDFAFQGCHPPQRLAAMVASHQPNLSQSWYSDTGATHHVTSDLDNISIHAPYHGSGSVQVGNGAALSISNTGQSLGEDALSRPN
ncbi:hypothetical protein MRB53_034166 [Persea americana]|uniref:Uncharacterized protein n=1 Tax=Persea americana TaxID=3435 RepID=A0ACC2KWW7_PERAE|nr:hypothetical protein MRB53_034166 [Persea americana]